MRASYSFCKLPHATCKMAFLRATRQMISVDTTVQERNDKNKLNCESYAVDTTFPHTTAVTQVHTLASNQITMASYSTSFTEKRAVEQSILMKANMSIQNNLKCPSM